MKLGPTIILVWSLAFVSGELQGSSHEAGVTARIASGHLVIENRTSRNIFYAVYETEALKLIEWAPACGDYNRIQPQGSVRIPLAADSFEPSGEANVFWWHDGKGSASADACTPEKIERVVFRVDGA